MCKHFGYAENNLAQGLDISNVGVEQCEYCSLVTSSEWHMQMPQKKSKPIY